MTGNVRLLENRMRRMTQTLQIILSEFRYKVRGFEILTNKADLVLSS